MDGFICIRILRNKVTNTATMTQTGLIDPIQQTTAVVDANAKYTPADKEPLHTDLGGELCCE